MPYLDGDWEVLEDDKTPAKGRKVRLRTEVEMEYA
jgi:hypothetical protein